MISEEAKHDSYPVLKPRNHKAAIQGLKLVRIRWFASLLSLPKSGLYLQWPSLEVMTLGEELLQQKLPKNIPNIMFLLVTTCDLLKEQSDCYWYWVSS